MPIKLTKIDTASPALVLTGPNSIAIKAGLVIASESWSVTIENETPVELVDPVAGQDYAVVVNMAGEAKALPYDDADHAIVIGGFHYAPGGNAAARSGGDATPQINPYSVWDQNFRPACIDPRGMALVDGRFWADIYLLGVNHHESGTSRYAVQIADGRTPPFKPDSIETYDEYEFTWFAANEVFAHHGKTLLSVIDFFDAMFGVTEETSAGDDPDGTGLDAPRTSKWGIMQATGNMWTWGHDGDPDKQHAYILGGGWADASYAGSRASHWVDYPWNSSVDVGARGRSDHLNLDELAR